MTLLTRLHSLSLRVGSRLPPSLSPYTQRNLSSSVCRYSVNLSYASSPSDHTLSGATIGELFNKQVEATPDRDMIVFSRDNVRLTYQQFKSKMDDLAAGLLALGLKPGDRVGIWSPNRAEWVLTQIATAHIGLIMVNVNPAYRVQELEYAIQKVGMKAMIMAESFKTQDYYEMMFELFPELSRCPPGRLQCHRAPELTSVVIMGDTVKPGTHTFNQVCQMGTQEHRLEMEKIAKNIHFDEPVNIQFTSGTTGNPKGATLTHHNLVNNSRFIGYRMGYHETINRICLPVPLYHCFGMVGGSMMNVVHGVTCVYPAPSFEPEASLQSIQSEKCNILYGTPTMFIDTLNHPNFDNYDVTSLESGIMAGSPCPIEVMKEVNDKLHMPKACVAYGSTETSPVTFLTFPDDSLEKRCGSIGCLLDHTEAKIVDETGQVVPEVKDKAKTDSAISPTQWYHTGDIGIMDEDGYVMINGRIKDMIIRGGENVFPVEIEQFLYTHPAIEDVQIVGVPDKRMGEEICACIRVKEGMSVSEQELKDFCKGEISHFKIPKYVVCVESFPLTVTGKVQKFVMRADLVEKLGLQHEAP
ncbi:ACSF2 [Bugula neritina]|uniref:Medium-chain acyl-CoA ligase ACSF2, mitochondrial n=1 Tax=Bugula neritina TaxID=10212 RepID=A0A7J7KBL4_BUGNE|nr:ACSF2 [Bugula neritina]